MRWSVVLAVGALMLLAMAVVAGRVDASGTDQAVANGRIAFVQTISDHRSIWLIDSDGRHPRMILPDAFENARATPSRDGTRLFLKSNRGGDLDVWSVAPDGTSPVNLTNAPGDDFQPDPSPDDRQFVFVSDRSGNWDLWTTGTAGGPARRLTGTRQNESYPAWSPDGRSIAFTRWTDDSHGRIVVRTLTTGRERLLTDASRAVYGVRWAPDSHRLAYTAEKVSDGHTARVVVLDLRTGRRTALPRVGECNYHEYPDWSPNGKRLVLHATSGTGFGLWTIGADGRHPQQLRGQDGRDWPLFDYETVRWTQRGFVFTSGTVGRSVIIETINLDGSQRTAVTSEVTNSGLADMQPAWSPDGSMLAFSRGGEIFLVQPDGTGLQNLSRGNTNDQEPVWSPDGTHIAFAGDAGKPNLVDIFTMRTDGTERANLTRMAGNDAEPDWGRTGEILWSHFPVTEKGTPPGDVWTMHADGTVKHALLTGPVNDEEARISPDGSTIVFLSQRDGHMQLYLMNADGSNLRRLIASDADDREPQWSPDGEYVVFSRVTTKNAAIWVVGADGSNPHPITDVCVTAECVKHMTPTSPSWQPITP